MMIFIIFLTNIGACFSSAQLEPEHQCAFCFDAIPQVQFMPCGHIALCNACDRKYKREYSTCPICRTEISKRERYEAPSDVKESFSRGAMKRQFIKHIQSQLLQAAVGDKWAEIRIKTAFSTFLIENPTLVREGACIHPETVAVASTLGIMKILLQTPFPTGITGYLAHECGSAFNLSLFVLSILETTLEEETFQPLHWPGLTPWVCLEQQLNLLVGIELDEPFFQHFQTPTNMRLEFTISRGKNTMDDMDHIISNINLAISKQLQRVQASADKLPEGFQKDKVDFFRRYITKLEHPAESPVVVDFCKQQMRLNLLSLRQSCGSNS